MDRAPADMKRLFLTQDDLSPLVLGQDDRELDGSLRDDAEYALFKKYNGLKSGMACWNDPSLEHCIFRAVDIRWVFASSEDAHQWLSVSTKEQSESLPPLAPFPGIRREAYRLIDEAVSFGGEDPLSRMLLGEAVSSYIVLWRRGNMVAKLYVAGKAGRELSPELVGQLATIAIVLSQGTQK